MILLIFILLDTKSRYLNVKKNRLLKILINTNMIWFFNKENNILQ